MIARALAATRWLRHWVPFTACTVFYGSVSVLLGPLTPQRGVSLWAMRSWSRSCLRLLHISVDVQGLEGIPAGAFVYACNHQSLLDTLLLASTLPGDVKWAVKSSLTAIPFLGWHLWLAGHVRVERGVGRREAVETVERFAGVLRRGKPLLVFPEGTRSRDGRIGPFKKGPFYAAVRAGVPVVPVALHGTGALMEKGAGNMASGSGAGREVSCVPVRVGAPLIPLGSGTEADRAADLRDRAHAAVVEMNCQLQESQGRIVSGASPGA